eukprot:TRINITY_DN70342_c0_g1_i1.p1 TRINITY_DN70342_c0_g1~~TRINITY_DN70342_c0_g1_i1.p1  ORF type:complete len:558 (+),score=162.57 TRINITY_DN70342_c0_g1_i1:77-1675(+)
MAEPRPAGGSRGTLASAVLGVREFLTSVELPIRLPDGGEERRFTARGSEQVGQLKRRAAAAAGAADPDRFRLRVARTGKLLDESATLGSAGIAPHEQLELVEETMTMRTQRVLGRLRDLYRRRVGPVEELTHFAKFRAALRTGSAVAGGAYLSDNLEHTKPMVTFLGPYSVGKSTFINHLLGTDRLHTGPEPTTDKFTVLLHERDAPGPVSGAALAARADLPFRGLQRFGDAFLQNLVGQPLGCDLLEGLTFVDTPGMLEAASDVKKRPYNFIDVCRWFVECSDLVFIIFDPSKLDAGHELRELFRCALPGNESKVRIVLNKADSVAPWDLMRIYGALYWNLSNMIHTTEPPRLYVGSFWGNEYRPGTAHEHFRREREDLLRHVRQVAPQQSVDRRVSLLRSRARAALLHAFVCRWVWREVGTLAGMVPMAQNFLLRRALSRLPEAFDAAQQHHPALARVDYPPREAYHAFFLGGGAAPLSADSSFKLTQMVPGLDKLVSEALPQLLSQAPTAAPAAASSPGPDAPPTRSRL